MQVKKATPLMEDKCIFSISRNGLISLESICMDSPRYIKYSSKTLKIGTKMKGHLNPNRNESIKI